MAATESRMLELGTPAPDFALPDPNGNIHALADAKNADAVIVMFICNHCPFVKHIRRELVRLGKDYAAQNVAIFAINSNDALAYPGDNAEAMKREVQEWGYEFPYLIDGDQTVAKSYKAACTPDIFVFNGDRQLAYRGQLDASRPSNDIPVTGSDLRGAVDAILTGRPVNKRQIPSIGCNIKWKPGNEPDWSQ
jgi:peroxiredoxin